MEATVGDIKLFRYIDEITFVWQRPCRRELPMPDLVEVITIEDDPISHEIEDEVTREEQGQWSVRELDLEIKLEPKTERGDCSGCEPDLNDENMDWDTVHEFYKV